MKIVGVTGSLRKKSLNTSLLKEIGKMLGEKAEYEILVPNLPLFSQDLEKGKQKEVEEFNKKIKEADFIVFSCPEHNHTFTAVIKNALEWGSMAEGGSVWKGKRAALIGASTGSIATARAQLILRVVLADMEMELVKNQILVGNAQEKIDEDGNVTDEHTKEKLQELVDVLN